MIILSANLVSRSNATTITEGERVDFLRLLSYADGTGDRNFEAGKVAKIEYTSHYPIFYVKTTVDKNIKIEVSVVTFYAISHIQWMANGGSCPPPFLQGRKSKQSKNFQVGFAIFF